MCGRFILTVDLARILESFDAHFNERRDFAPRYNIAPTQEIPVIVSDSTSLRSLQWMRWGLIPSWSKPPAKGTGLTNARAESAAEKPSFRSPFRERRCIIPASGFYEWQKIGKGKIPHLIEVVDQPVFAMAGLWDQWRVRDLAGSLTGEILETCTILTVEAVHELQWLHHRMPRILSPHEIEKWLNPATDPKALEQWIQATPSQLQIRFRALSRKVNSSEQDSPDLIQNPPEIDLFGNWVVD